MLRALVARFRDLLRRDDLEAEMREELDFHRAMLARDARAGGVTPELSALRAQRRLGNLTRLNEELRAMWGFAWIDEMSRNVRYALRGMARSPGFTAAVIVTLSLGIGANAAMFSIIDRLMFRPYPYLRDAGTVNRVYIDYTDRGVRRPSPAFEYTRFLDFRRWTTSFENSSAFATRAMAVGVGDAARERDVASVSASFWDFFDAPPALGRYFRADEDTTPRGAEVVVLGYDFWRAEFGGRNVIGEVLQVGNVPAVIIGVAPRRFTGVRDGAPPVAYLPITTYAGSVSSKSLRESYYLNYNWGWMEMMVRRKPGVSVDAGAADLTAAFARSWNAERALSPSTPTVTLAKPSALIASMKLAAGPTAGLEERTARWITGVAVIVLLIACANVANLFLARALARRREFAVRRAMGVSWRRLVGQCVTESLALALLGCAGGVLVAQWGGAGLRAFFTSDGMNYGVINDWRTIALAAAVAIAAGVVTGLAPLFAAGRDDLATALKAGVREGTSQRSRTRAALLVAQGALSVILLVGAGLFVRSLGNARDVRLGYDADRVVLVEARTRGVTPQSFDRADLSSRLLAAAQSMPGVEHAAWVNAVPFWSNSGTLIRVQGIDSISKLGRFTFTTSTPDYFATMGTRIVKGRPFDATDRAGTEPVVVVSDAMAQALWPGQDPLGKCITIGADTMPCRTVIGVTETFVQRDLAGRNGYTNYSYFMPIAQYETDGGFAVLARVTGDPAAIVEPIRKRLQAEMPGQSYVVARPFGRIVDEQRRSWAMGATMFVAFGLLALAVAAVGMYGVIAYDVAQRSHELGVRAALGAARGDIVRLVVGQGLRFGAAGIVIGGGTALWMGRFVKPLLFRQDPADPLVYGVVAVTLIAVALGASVVPAMRAMRADPVRALRAD